MYLMTRAERQDKIAELEAELLDWVEGRQSFNNLVMAHSDSPAQAIVYREQADAAHIQGLTAALLGLRGGL